MNPNGVTQMIATVHQQHRAVIVELRRNEGERGGYIAAQKQYDYETMQIQPAEVVFNIAFNYGNGMTGHSPKYAREIARLIDQAALVCELLDHHIEAVDDFAKVITVEVLGGKTVIMDVSE